MVHLLKKILSNILSLFILDTFKRREFRKKILYKRILPNRYKRRKKPIEPWAFIRVKNEIITIDSCLKSILPVIKKGVIGYNDCDDGTEEYIIEFCKKNPGFIPVKYPYYVYPPNHNIYKKKDEEEKHKLAAYYNYVLSYIPKNEWIIKIDCDHVYNSQKLKKILYVPIKNNDFIIIPRLDLHVKNNQVFTITETPIVEGRDYFLVKNNELVFKNTSWYSKENEKTIFHACEALYLKGIHSMSRKLDKFYNFIYVEVNNYHFPIVKKWRDLSEYEEKKLIPFSEFKKNKSKYKGKIDTELLNENNILSIYHNFNLEKKRVLP